MTIIQTDVCSEIGINYGEMSMRLKADLNRTIDIRRQWHNIFRVLRENHHQPGIFYSAKLLFKREKNTHSLQCIVSHWKNYQRIMCFVAFSLQEPGVLLSLTWQLSSLLCYCCASTHKVEYAGLRGCTYLETASPSRPWLWYPESQNFLPKHHRSYLQIQYGSLSPISCPKSVKYHWWSYP